jgi:phage gpG-like protein
MILEGRISKPKAFLKQAGDYMVASVQANINASGRPEQWKATIWGNPPLYKTGKLIKSIRITELDDTHVTVSSDSKATSHNAGYQYNPRPRQRAYVFAWLNAMGLYDKTKANKKSAKTEWTVPARPFFLFQDADVEYLKNKLIEYIEKG